MSHMRFFYLGVKTILQRFLCFVLVISVSSFGTHTLKTSVNIPSIVPHTFFEGIHREASSLEEELRYNLKRLKRWPLLFQRVANARLVLETTEIAFQKSNLANLKNFWCLSQEYANRTPRTQFSYDGIKRDPSTVSLFCIGQKYFQFWDPYSEDFSLHSWHHPSHIYLKYRLGSELVGREQCATLNDRNDGQCSSNKWVNARPVLETPENAFQWKKWAKRKNFRCSSQEIAH